jgi:hypothetical protein
MRTAYPVGTPSSPADWPCRCGHSAASGRGIRGERSLGSACPLDMPTVPLAATHGPADSARAQWGFAGAGGRYRCPRIDYGSITDRTRTATPDAGHPTPRGMSGRAVGPEGKVVARHRSPQGRRTHLGLPLPPVAAAAGAGGPALASNPPSSLAPRVVATARRGRPGRAGARSSARLRPDRGPEARRAGAARHPDPGRHRATGGPHPGRRARRDRCDLSAAARRRRWAGQGDRPARSRGAGRPAGDRDRAVGTPARVTAPPALAPTRAAAEVQMVSGRVTSASASGGAASTAGWTSPPRWALRSMHRWPAR